MLWAAIQTLDEGQRHALLALMQEQLMLPELRRGDRAKRIAKIVAALNAAADQLAAEAGAGSRAEVKLTEEQYERLRRLNPMESWPPPSTVRRWMSGSWNDALRQARLQPVFDGDALVAEIGPKFTREEVIAAVQAYHAEGHQDVPTISAFISWARRPEVLARPGRRPRSQNTIQRLFPQGWPQLLAAAGIIATTEKPGAMGTSWAVARPAWGTGYKIAHVHEALRSCAFKLGRSPKMMEYAAWREDEFIRQREDGELPKAIPSTGLIQNRYRTWDEALIDAGLDPARGRSNPSRRGGYPPRPKRIGEDEVMAAICEAYEKIGDPFTSVAYKQWRKDKVVENLANRSLDKVPGYALIHERYGTWTAAVRAARQWQERQQRASRRDGRRDESGDSGASDQGDADAQAGGDREGEGR